MPSDADTLVEVTITLRTKTGSVTFAEFQPPQPVGLRGPVRVRLGGEMINRVAANARAWMRTQDA